jgi:hypothetical protein
MRKFRLPLQLSTALALLSAASLRADFIGSDNFNDNSKDPTKWGADIVLSTGLQTETNGRLEYTQSASGFDISQRPWILNSGSYVDSWAVQMDAHLDLGLNQSVSFFLAKTGDFNRQADLIFQSFPFNAPAPPAFVNAQIIPDISNFNGRVTGQVGTASGDLSLRIAFDALTKELTLQWDADGANNGYVWSTIAQGDIASGVADWGMTDTSTFYLAISQAGSGPVASGQNYADNFSATTVPEPSSLPLVTAGAFLMLLAGWNSRRNRASERVQ